MSDEGKGGSGWRPGIATRGKEGASTTRGAGPREPNQDKTRATRRGRNQGEEADLHSDGAEPCTKKKKTSRSDRYSVRVDRTMSEANDALGRLSTDEGSFSADGMR